MYQDKAALRCENSLRDVYSFFLLLSQDTFVQFPIVTFSHTQITEVTYGMAGLKRLNGASLCISCWSGERARHAHLWTVDGGIESNLRFTAFLRGSVIKLMTFVSPAQSFVPMPRTYYFVSSLTMHGKLGYNDNLKLFILLNFGFN